MVSVRKRGKVYEYRFEIAKQGYYYNLYMSKEENKKFLKYCT